MTGFYMKRNNGLKCVNVTVKPHTRPYITAQKMKFSIKDFFGKCDRIRRKLLIWSHLLKKS